MSYDDDAIPERGLDMLRVSLALVLLTMSCRAHEQYHQIQTIANMRAITTSIDDLRDKGQPVNENDVREAIARVGNGRDAWGTPLAFRVRSKKPLSYVLVSAGSDRKFELSDLNGYFAINVRDVRSDPRHDLVFKDGDLITLAGK
jgi:hypothetical protein